jgi:hypothetical protein
MEARDLFELVEARSHEGHEDARRIAEAAGVVLADRPLRALRAFVLQMS